MKKKPLLIFLFFLILNLIPHLYVALASNKSLLNWYITDDAFYYFKVAQNISEGRGITFDGIAPTNGFHPLWMLVCIPVFALARLDLYLPLRVLVIVQAVFNAASGYFLYRLFADHFSEKAAWIVAFCWMFIPSIHAISSKLGLESGLSIFCLIFFIYQLSRHIAKEEQGRADTGGLLRVSLAAILVLFSRLDNIFLLLMAGLWLVFRGSRMRWMSQIDLLLIFASAVLSYFSRIQSTDNIFNFLPFFYMLTGFSLVIKPVCLFLGGLYELHGKVTLRRFIFKTAAVLTVASLLIGMIFFVLHDLLHAFRGFSRAVLVLDWLFSLGLIVLFRVLIYWKNHDHFGLQENNIRVKIQYWFKSAAAYFLPLFGSLGLYMAANQAYAGSAMPVSGQIKRWWGTLPNTVYGRPIKTLSALFSSLFSSDPEGGPFWLLTRPLRQLAGWLGEFFQIARNSPGGSFMTALVWIVLIAAVVTILARRQPDFTLLSRRFALLPLFSGCVFHAVSYKATGYLHAKYWYWLGEMVLIVLFFGILWAISLKELESQTSSKWVLKSAVILVCLVLLGGFGYTILRDFPMNGETADLYDYDADIQFLKKNTQPGDVIGMTGGGVSAYLMPDRTFINLDGLINSSQYFESLREDHADEYLSQAGLDYVYGEELVLLDSDPYRWVFSDHLKLISHTSSQFSLYEFCGGGCDK